MLQSDIDINIDKRAEKASKRKDREEPRMAVQGK